MVTTILTDGILLNQQGAGTYAFRLAGGLYGISVVTSAGTVTVQSAPGPDGITPVPVTPAISATGYSTVYLPPGSYQVTIASGTLSVAVQRIHLT
jgi:hypothetical protein